MCELGGRTRLPGLGKHGTVERRGPTEEVGSLKEDLNNRRIRMYLGEDKMRWGYLPRGRFTIKEDYDLWTRVDN